MLSCFLHLRLRRGCGALAGLGRGLGPSAGSRRALRVLVDMDGVLADFEGGFLKKFRARYPDKPYIALEDRRGFWVSEQYGRLGPELSVSCASPAWACPSDPQVMGGTVLFLVGATKKLPQEYRRASSNGFSPEI